MKPKIYVNYHTLRIIRISRKRKAFNVFFFDDMQEPVQLVNTGLGDTELQLN